METDSLFASPSNASDDVGEAVTLNLQSSVTGLALIFHFVSMIVLILQVRIDQNVNIDTKLATKRGLILWFFAGMLCIIEGVYLGDDTDKHLAVLQEFYHIISGLGIGVFCLLIFCWGILKRNHPGRGQGVRIERHIDNLEQSCDENENQNNNLDRHVTGDDNLDTSQDGENIVLLEELVPVRNSVILLKAKLPYIDIFLAIMTFFIVIIELFFLFGLLGKHDFTESKNYKISFNGIRLFYLHNITTGTYMIQILVQPLCYIFLIKGHTLHSKFRYSTELFFKYMAFFNFTMVINSFWDCNWKQLDSYDNIKLGEYYFGPGFNIVFTIYSSMIINMRVLFVYLFLEYGNDLENVRKERESYTDNVTADEVPNNARNNNLGPVSGHDRAGLDNAGNSIVLLRQDDLLCRKLGLCIGFACVILQALMAVHYIQILKLSPWTTIFSVIADLQIVLSGWFMIQRNVKRAPNITYSDTKMDQFMRMVNLLGILSFIYCFLKVVLSSSLVHNYEQMQSESSLEYFKWSTVKHISAMITIPILLVCINVVNKLAPMTQNSWSKFDQLLLPALLFGVLGMVIGVTLDQYVGDIIRFTREQIQDTAIQILLETGPSLLLAFLMNVFLRLLLLFLKR